MPRGSVIPRTTAHRAFVQRTESWHNMLRQTVYPRTRKTAADTKITSRNGKNSGWPAILILILVYLSFLFNIFFRSLSRVRPFCPKNGGNKAAVFFWPCWDQPSLFYTIFIQTIFFCIIEAFKYWESDFWSTTRLFELGAACICGGTGAHSANANLSKQKLRPQKLIIL